MPNSRLLNKKISYSKQVNALSGFAQLLFTWTIPHLDNFGRIDGDPVILKAKVMPLSTKSQEEIEGAIQEMINVNLVERYETGEQLVIQYLKFDKYQKDIKKRTKSNFPENLGNSNNIQESSSNVEQSNKDIEIENNQQEIQINATEVPGNSEIPISSNLGDGQG